MANYCEDSVELGEEKDSEGKDVNIEGELL